MYKSYTTIIMATLRLDMCLVNREIQDGTWKSWSFSSDQRGRFLALIEEPKDGFVDQLRYFYTF